MRSRVEDVEVYYTDKKVAKWRDMQMYITMTGNEDEVAENLRLIVQDRGMRIELPLAEIVAKARREIPWLK